jgi:carbon-monoxide dehydrogenase large subunit
MSEHSKQIEIKLTVNGKPHAASCEPRKLLSDFLREDLALTGTHVGCEHGICGACTIHFNGEPARSCITLAVQANGASLQTIEGLATGGRMHALQQAFHENHGLQCGFCTPGMLMVALDLLNRNPSPTETEVREAISAVVCRCTGYRDIVRSVLAAAEKLKQEAAGGATPVAGSHTHAPPAGGDGKRRFVGQSVLRREDERLLTGQGQFISDLVLPGMLHAVFVRSSVAHGHIESVDLTRAAAAPGVVLAIAGYDLARDLPPVSTGQVMLPSRFRKSVKHKLHDIRQSLLAIDKVRHVGEAVAVIVATSRYAAEDAAELAVVNVSPLPAVVKPEKGLEAGAALVHEQCETNLIGEYSFVKGDVDAALARSPHRIERRIYNHRYSAVPMEGRGVVSAHDVRTNMLTVWASTQMAHWVRRDVATGLGLPESQVRCLALDVGGGFGVKGHVYPEDILIPFLARKLGRPVKWIEDRREHFLGSCHSRDQLHDLEVGFDDEGRVLAFRDTFFVDAGAWIPVGLAPVSNTATHLQGPYKIPNFVANAKIVATNKVPSAPYRGAGRPEAAFAMERIMEMIASHLGLEAAEVRRRNMIQRDEMPYAVGIPFRDGVPIVYDSGDFPQALEQALNALGGIDAFRTRQCEARKAGKYLGLGIGCYTEGTGAGPFEGATVRIDTAGKIDVATGACAQGQGMETVFAQVAADAWDVDPSDVSITLADTAAIQIGYGTIASRSTVTASGAICEASEQLKKKVFSIAAHLLECSADDLELRKGSVGIVGVPGQSISLSKIAQAARPGWDHGRPHGIDPGLETTYYFEPATATWAYAVHAAIVEVDIKLGRIRIDKYVVAHDCGTMVNPMLVEGQVIGGTVQGLGGVLLEEINYDDEGQLLTASFMDYLLPTASDVPDIQVLHQESPTPLNPLGVKGLGEGGAIAAPVTIANAITDALTPFKAEMNHTPIKPEDIFNAVRGNWPPTLGAR